jgi:2-hydroxy-6-oxonona-2,4-dienedioate hydrolase
LKELFAEIGGHKVRYISSTLQRTATETPTNAILFIHGLGSSADRWMDLPEAFTHYFPSYALDLIGFGKSDKPLESKYGIPEFVQLVRNFIDQVINPIKMITLIGHSLGGYIACEFAIRYPSFTRSLVLIDSSGMLHGPTALLREYLSVAMNPTYDECMSVFKKMVANPIFVSPLVANTFIMNISNSQAKNAFKLTLENSTNTQLDIEKLGNLKVPALIIWGAEDNVIPVEHASLFHKTIADSQLKIINHVGHAPFIEKPAVTFDIIKRFLVTGQ